MLEVRLDENGNAGIYGLAAPFYDGTQRTEFILFDDGTHRVVERIHPEFFDAAIDRGDDVRALYNHDANFVLGRTEAQTLTLTRTERGLEYAVPNPPASRADVVEALQRGDVDGSSFAFTIDAEEVTQDGDTTVIELRQIGKLYDVGPVAFPAYLASSSQARGEQSRAITTDGQAVQVRSSDAAARKQMVDQLLERRLVADKERRTLEWRTLEARLRHSSLPR